METHKQHKPELAKPQDETKYVQCMYIGRTQNVLHSSDECVYIHECISACLITSVTKTERHGKCLKIPLSPKCIFPPL